MKLHITVIKEMMLKRNVTKNVILVLHMFERKVKRKNCKLDSVLQ